MVENLEKYHSMFLSAPIEWGKVLKYYWHFSYFPTSCATPLQHVVLLLSRDLTDVATMTADTAIL